MPDASELQASLAGVLRYFRHPGIWIEVAVLALSLLVVELLRRTVAARPADRDRAVGFGRGGMRRIAGPLLALLLVLIASSVLARWGVNTGLLRLAIALLGSFVVVRAAVFALHILGWLDPLVDGHDQVGFEFGGGRASLWMVLRESVN
ncbi:MAG: hypothetical protein COW56_13310 [Rhodocyclales bacterium CG17_big_fil_post_rev_8_21_14_2_50_68_7]|nr:MAG: hypothetical protein COW56_13310 [Rhodocyclales bacterium CG17_big_fil_post_rev_8_21_14_2_50_68_7]